MSGTATHEYILRQREDYIGGYGTEFADHADDGSFEISDTTATRPDEACQTVSGPWRYGR